MKFALDSSVLIAALHNEQPNHQECLALFTNNTPIVAAHGLVETFSTLTGGKLGFRRPPALVAQILAEDIAPLIECVQLTTQDIIASMVETEPRGIRGGAIYDYLHLAAARKAGADRFYTLNMRHFEAFHRTGDPEIAHP